MTRRSSTEAMHPEGPIDVDMRVDDDDAATPIDSDEARGRKRAAEAMVEALQPAESTSQGAAAAPTTPTRASSSSEAVVLPSE
eukprot:10148340-Alexandrium_andersonii.AAC.1